MCIDTILASVFTSDKENYRNKKITMDSHGENLYFFIQSCIATMFYA